jgi:anti-anti-sigma factor
MQGPVIGKLIVNGVTVVQLAGELDVVSVPDLRRELVVSASATLPDMVLDLREVDFMDCGVVGVLIAVRGRATAAGGCLRLVGVQQRPRRLLDLCRLDQVFCIHESFASATATKCTRHAHVQAATATVPVQTARVAAITDEPRGNGANENPAMS